MSLFHLDLEYFHRPTGGKVLQFDVQSVVVVYVCLGVLYGVLLCHKFSIDFAVPTYRPNKQCLVCTARKQDISGEPIKAGCLILY